MDGRSATGPRPIKTRLGKNTLSRLQRRLPILSSSTATKRRLRQVVHWFTPATLSTMFVLIVWYITTVNLPHRFLFRSHFSFRAAESYFTSHKRKNTKKNRQLRRLETNRFPIAWEIGIQVPSPFFVFAWHLKTDLNRPFSLRGHVTSFLWKWK